MVISIHALRGEGDNRFGYMCFKYIKISIHALRGEGDGVDISIQSDLGISIHALRGEGDDKFNKCPAIKTDISIHALRGEGDSFKHLISPPLSYFNPRPPWGGRQWIFRQKSKTA